MPLGPACSNTVEPIAGVSKHYRTLVISYSAEGSISNDQDKEFPYFFRTIAENKQYKWVLTVDSCFNNFSKPFQSNCSDITL